MRVVLTGASSVPGGRVLKRLLEDPNYLEIWCGIHKRDLPIEHQKLRKFELDLGADVNLDQIAEPIDLLIHFAALTHARNEQDYWDINVGGTLRLVQAARARGCRRVVYISTRCATVGSGAYGESKLAAEVELQESDWESLIILRPSEAYGGGGQEGVDSFIRLASRMHLAPVLFGNANIQFSPIHIADFVECTYAQLKDLARGVKVVELCGPESLTGWTLAWRIAKRYKAVPIPVWFDGLRLFKKILAPFGWWPFPPDQISRLVGPKTANSSSGDCLATSEMIRFPDEAPNELA